MSTASKERKRAAIRARKQAAKARLAEPPQPPSVPVALPWRRRSSGRRASAEREAWSAVMSGDAGDLEGSLASIARFVRALGPVLKGGR